MTQRIEEIFAASASLNLRAAPVLAPLIVKAAATLITALDDNKHIFACGNGGSACDAQHLASELVNRFERQRPALAAMALTTDSAILTSVANDSDYKYVFSRQIEAWGRSGDILVAISTSGRSSNIITAVTTAQALGMRVIALSGGDGGALSGCLNADAVEIRVPATQTARIQEIHLLSIHSLCYLIDAHFAH